jgi:hypothetical protein
MIALRCLNRNDEGLNHRHSAPNNNSRYAKAQDLSSNVHKVSADRNAADSTEAKADPEGREASVGPVRNKLGLLNKAPTKSLRFLKKVRLNWGPTLLPSSCGLPSWFGNWPTR